MKVTLLVIAVLSAAVAHAEKYDAAGAYDGGGNNIHDAGLYRLELHDPLWFGDENGGYGGGNYPGQSGVTTFYQGLLWVGTNCWGQPRVSGGYYFRPEWHETTGLLWNDLSNWDERPSYIQRESALDCYGAADDGDAREQGPIGLLLEVHSMQWSDAANDDYILFQYRVVNDAGRQLPDLHAAFYFDCDIGGQAHYMNDRLGVDESRDMLYTYNMLPTLPYVGILFVDGDACGGGEIRSFLVNDTDAERWQAMTTYSWRPIPNPTDCRGILTTGPYNLEPNEKLRLGVAIVAGADLAALQNNADAARAKYWEVFTGITDFGINLRNGAAVLTWEPSSPYMGYNLYRGTPAGESSRLNAELVAGRPPYEYVDADVVAGETYDYRLEAVDANGGSDWFGPIRLRVPDTVRKSLSVRGPYPCPATDRIRFFVTGGGPKAVSFSYYDLAGREIGTASWDIESPREKEITADTSYLPPGVYLFKIASAGEEITGRFAVTR